MRNCCVGKAVKLLTYNAKGKLFPQSFPQIVQLEKDVILKGNVSNSIAHPNCPEKSKINKCKHQIKRKKLKVQMEHTHYKCLKICCCYISFIFTAKQVMYLTDTFISSTLKRTGQVFLIANYTFYKFHVVFRMFSIFILNW